MQSLARRSPPRAWCDSSSCCSSMRRHALRKLERAGLPTELLNVIAILRSQACESTSAAKFLSQASHPKTPASSKTRRLTDLGHVVEAASCLREERFEIVRLYQLPRQHVEARLSNVCADESKQAVMSASR
eukprot:6194142-Pleurochrysis_carterae.AAC.4